MSEESLNKQSTGDRNTPDAPHVLSRLQMIISGEYTPTHDEYEQMLNHVVLCTYCQNALEMSIAAVLDVPTGNPVMDSAHKLLMQVKAVGNKVQEREDQIAAYAEVLETYGEKEADKRYPELSEHLKICEACRAKVKDMQIALRQAEQVGLVAPLRRSAEARA